MESSQPPKSEDVLKNTDKKLGDQEVDSPLLPPRLNEAVLGLDGLQGDQEQPDAGAEDKEEKKSKKKKSDKVFSRFIPQPDLVETGDDQTEKSSWATKVSDLLGITSSGEGLSDQDELPPISESIPVRYDQVAGDGFEAGLTPPVTEGPLYEASEPPRNESVGLGGIESGNAAESPAEASERAPDTLDVGGGDGGEPPELPPRSGEAPVPPEPRPESVQAILARQSAELSDSGVTSSESGDAPTHVTNNYYQRADLVPALVVDQLSRRRDRKIRRHDRAQDRTIKTIQRQVDQLDQRVEASQQKTVEQTQPIVRPAAEQILRQTSSVERTTEFQGGEIRESRKPESIQPAITPEQSRQTLDPPVEQKIKSPVVAAEQIQKVVEAAAEAAVPIETLYEMRHEIKGNEDFSAAAEASIQSRSSYSNNEMHEISSANIEQQINTQPSSRADDGKSQLYGQAAKGGALAAFAFILAFLILYFLLLRG